MITPGLLIEERSASVALWIVFRREKKEYLAAFLLLSSSTSPPHACQPRPLLHQTPLSGINIVVLSWQSFRCNQRRRPRTTHRILAQFGRQRCRIDFRHSTIDGKTNASEELINGIIALPRRVGSDSDCLRHLHPNEARSVGCAPVRATHFNREL